MRLILDRDLFAVQSEAEAMDLLDLLTTAVRDPHAHALLTDLPYLPGGQNGPIDVWLNGRASPEASAFRGLLAAGLIAHATRPVGGGASDAMRPRRWHLEGPLTIRVERRPTSDWQGRALTLADAAGLLREPLHLVLENARTELAFVRLLAGPTDGAALRALIDAPGRIAVHGGGGGEGRKWLEALAEGAPTPAVWRRLLRTWVLFDRDTGEADVRDPSGHAAELIDLCERVTSVRGGGLSWSCLQRREIESYVPDRGLVAEKTDRQKAFVDQVIAWRANPAREVWAWSLDLKKGLHGDRHPRWSTGLSDADIGAVKKGDRPLEAHMLKLPFSGLSATDISALARGLGDRLGEALRADTAPAWSSDLPAEYDRGPSDQAPRRSFVQSLFDRM